MDITTVSDGKYLEQGPCPGPKVGKSHISTAHPQAQTPETGELDRQAARRCRSFRGG